MLSDSERNRPLALLNDCLRKYGLDRNRRTSTEQRTVTYLRITDGGDEEARWVLGGVDDNPAVSLAQAFRRAVGSMRNAHENDLPISEVHAYAMVVHGEGACVFENPDTGERCFFSELPPEHQDSITARASSDLHLRTQDGTKLPTRVVSLISLEGLATEISVWLDNEAHVESTEQWIHSDDDAMPVPEGEIGNALMGAMTFTQLCSECYERGYSLDVEGMMKAAWDVAGDDKEMVAFLLRVVASGLEQGLLSRDD